MDVLFGILNAVEENKEHEPPTERKNIESDKDEEIVKSENETYVTTESKICDKTPPSKIARKQCYVCKGEFNSLTDNADHFPDQCPKFKAALKMSDGNMTIEEIRKILLN